MKGVSAWWRSIWQRASASNRSKLKMSAAANSAVRVTSDPLPAPRARPRACASSPRLEIKSSLPRQRTEPIPLPLLAKSYWRIAGMSYLKYSSMCAEVVRGCLKEPFLTKVSHRFPVSALATPAVPRITPSPVLSRPLRARVLTSNHSYPRPQAKPREAVYFKSVKWTDGKPGKPGE